MATRAELQQVVDDTTAITTTARTAWKHAIPGEHAPKMTKAEQKEVDALEAKYIAAKDVRTAAERALADFNTAEIARKAADSAAVPVAQPTAPPAPVAQDVQAKFDKKLLASLNEGSDVVRAEKLEEAWKQQAKRAGYPGRPQPAGWNPFN